MANLPIVDWRGHLGELAPLLRGTGGRACVIGTEPSGWRHFAEVARQEVELRCQGCLTIKLDPQSDENTHYGLDILRTMERKLGLPGLQPAAGTTEVLNDLDVEGDVNIENVYVIVGSAGWETDSAVEWRRRSITDEVASLLDRRRVVLFLHCCEAMSNRDANWFWRDLWGEGEGGLLGLVDRGLALVCCCQTDARCPHQGRVAAPQFRVRLPSQYTAADREAATADLTELVATARGVPLAEARGLAEYCLEDADYEPEDVYGSLPALLRWGRR